MSEVDDKVVSITFDNTDFERNVAETIASLDKLRESLDFSGALSSFSDLNAAANDVNLSGVGESLMQVGQAADNVDFSRMGMALDNISSKFSAMGAVGFSVIQSLTQSVLGFAGKMLHLGQTDILGPILTGGKKRAMNIEQAKFMFEGLGIDIDQGMKSALDAVLGTAYGLDEAAKAAAQFGASGIKVGAEMTGALRGVAGAAAMTGSSFTEMADIFAGSAGTGFVNNQDLMQFATRGLNAAAAIAPILHTTEAGVHELATNGELDFKTFAAAMDQAFGKHATEANKTYAGSLANLHAAMSRLGASLISPLLTQQRDVFNALSPLIDHVAKALSPLVYQFQVLTRLNVDQFIKFIDHVNNLEVGNLAESMQNFADAFRNTYEAIAAIIAAIKVGFNDVFPPSSVSLIYNISMALANFTEKLKANADTLEKVRQVAKAFFTIVKVLMIVLKILWDVFQIGFAILKEVFVIFGNIVAAFAPATGGVLTFAEASGKMADKIKDFLVTGGAIHRFFMALTPIIMAAVGVLVKVKDAIGGFFAGLGHSEIAEAGMDRINKRMDSLAGAPDKIAKSWDNFHEKFKGVFDTLDRVGEAIVKWFEGLPDKIANALKGAKFDTNFDVVNIGILAILTAWVTKFFIGKAFANSGLFGLIDAIHTAFGSLTGYLKALTKQVKTNMLLKIAYAVGILTASMLVLSMINSKDLTKALAAMTAGLTDIVAAMIILDKNTGGKDLVGKTTGTGKIFALGVAIDAIAAAMLIMAGAIAILGKMDPEELARGLASLTAAMAVITIAIRVMGDAENPVLASSGLAILLIAKALQILAKAVKDFAAIDYWDLAHGMGAIAVGLYLIIDAMQAIPVPLDTMAAAGAILLIAFALLILSKAVTRFADIGWRDLGHGLLAIAAILFIITDSMSLLTSNPNFVGAAAAILIISGALLVMSRVVKILGDMKLGNLAKGVIALSFILAEVVASTNEMTLAIPGAQAMVLVAAALYVMAKAIKLLGEMKLLDIAKGLGALLLGIAAIAAESAALAELSPLIVAFGVALASVGLAVALFGAGVFLLANGLALMAVMGNRGAKQFILVVKTIGKGALEITKTIGKFLGGLLLELYNLLPKLQDFLLSLIEKLTVVVIALIHSIAEVIRARIKEIIDTGLFILLALLQGIQDNIGPIVDAVSNIIINFVSELKEHKNLDKIIQAGVDILVKILEGIANAIDQISGAVADIIAALLLALSGAPLVASIVEAGSKIIGHIIKGLLEASRKADAWAESAVEIVHNLLTAMTKAIVGITNEIELFLITLMHRMAVVIRKNSPLMDEAGKELARAILGGLHLGFLEGRLGLKADGAALINAAIEGAAERGLIRSPSKVFKRLGEYMVQGLSLGLQNTASAEKNSVNLVDITVAAFREQLKKVATLADIGDINPVISPVLDLSNVKRGASALNDMLTARELKASMSLDTARVISSVTRDNNVDNTSMAQPVSGGVIFNQTNNSPKALSTNDIYRNTKSQIALAKEKLGIS